MAERREKNVVIVDPDMWMDRTLHYKEKHSGWVIFTSIYWSIYLLLVGSILIFFTKLGFTVASFFGIIIFIFAIMMIIFGFTQSLHYKLMKKYG